MRRKISLALSAVLLFTTIVWAADNDGWTEAPYTEAAQNGAWEEWCEKWETEKNNWEKISLTPGADETQLNFAWYSKDSSETPEFRWYEDDTLSPAGAQIVTQSNAVLGYYSNKVTVEGIEPGTTYYYSYTVDGEWTEPVEYTSADSTDSFSFVFFGDPQIGSSNENIPTGESSELGQDRSVRNDSFNWNNTVEKAYELNPELSFMVSAGDQIQTRDKSNSDSSHATYTENEIEYTGYLSPELLKKIPVATTIGNHDALSTNYTYHFNNPNASDIGSTYAGGDYYFTYGNVLFIMINTNNTNVAEHGSFIEDVCNEYPDTSWRIVTLHQDIYGSGEHSNEPEILELRYGLIPILEENNIDVVLTGHDHTYSRSYIMKGGTMDESNFISQDDYDLYIDGEKEIDSTYNNYLTSIEDADHITSTEDVVINPDGILYLTANSASGSKYYDLVEHQQAYIAARWQEDVPTFSMIDVSDNRFTINTYRTDTMEKIDTEFTIIKDSSASSTDTSTEETTETSTETSTDALTQTTTESSTEISTDASTQATTETSTETTTKKHSGGSSGAGASSLTVNGYTTTETTETTTEETSNLTAHEKTEETTVSVTSNTVKVSIGSTDVEINGSTKSMDIAPYIQISSNSTMVPLRFVVLAISEGNIDDADSANAVQWDAVSKTVTINANDNIITFTSGSNVMTINGVKQTMDNGAEAEIKDGRMFIPFRALGNALGVNVDWDAETKTATYS